MARRPQQLASGGISRPLLLLMLLALLRGHALAARLGPDVAPIRAQPGQAAVPSMELPVFGLAELVNAGDDASVLQRLRHAVFDVGMFAVSAAADPATTASKTAFNDPASNPTPRPAFSGFLSASEPASRSALQPTAAAAAAPALGAFARCAGGDRLADSLHSVQLDDGSTRSTLATATEGGRPQLLPRAVQSRCPDLVHPATQLRAAVDQTGLAYAAALDLLINGQGTRAAAGQGKEARGLNGGLDKEGTADGTAAGAAESATGTVGKVAGFDSYLDAVRHGESLEHFHLFSRQEGAGDGATGRAAPGGAAAALQMHSDIGLFIVMTPAQYFRTSSTTEGTGGRARSTARTAAGADGHAEADGTVADSDAWQEVVDAEGQGEIDSAASRRPGLYLELPDGRVVRPVFPAGSLLVMSGEGCGKWMRARAGAQAPPAAAHEVVLPTDMQGMVRAWYGRMYFPMSDATLQQSLGAAVHTLAQTTHSSASTTASTAATSDTTAASRTTAASSKKTAYGAPSTTGSATASSTIAIDASPPAPVTFGEYRRQTMAAFQAGQAHFASTVGCSTSRQLLQDQGSCPAGQFYCWMQCMTIPADLGCSKDAVQCKNPAGQIWPADFPQGDASHCFDCALTCPASQNATIPVASGFCNSKLTAITMWMTGFQFSGISSGPCVALLFPTWTLDSEVKFAFACIGTFLLGMGSGALGYFRTALMKSRLRGPVGGGGGAETLKGRSVSTLGLTGGPATAAPAKGGWFGWVDGASPKVWRLTHLAVELFLYAVQMTIAYFLMLIAMTYEAELFIMVVLGLTAGHGVLLCIQDEAKQEGGARACEGGAGACGQNQAMLAEANPEPCCCA